MNLEKILKAYDFNGMFRTFERFGNGHINDTYRLSFNTSENEVKKYIVQRINTEIFKDPDALMHNVFAVTDFLRQKLSATGGDPERGTLQFLRTRDGGMYFTDHDGCFRCYRYIEDVIGLDLPRNEQDFYESAVAFGRFQHLLSDFPAQTLYEVIPDFHNTVDRFEKLKAAIESDKLSRADSVQKEIEFALKRIDDAEAVQTMVDSGELRLRVTHNDTKLNNVLLDSKTSKAVCVIDLDTVMPGLSINDFGDSIRFGASTAKEDEADLDKVTMSLDMFEIYTKGYLEGCCGVLTAEELAMLPMGAKMMTLECGIRFLTDYLEGDHYFKISHPRHNLDRCRTQLKLVWDMEQKMDKMQQIVESIASK